MHQLDTVDPQIKNVLANQALLIQSPMKNISAAESIVNTSHKAVTDLSGKIRDLGNLTSNSKNDIAISDLEKELANLKLDYVLESKVAAIETEIKALKSAVPTKK